MQRSPFTPTVAATTRVARAQYAAVDLVVRIAVLAATALIFLAATAMRAAAATQDTPTALHTSSDSAPTATDRAMAPSPTLAPDEVVGIVLSALARNDSPVKDHGISVTFGFASPANRAFVGPVESFAELVRDDTYRPLLNHRHAARGPAHVTGDRATVRVVITTVNGERVAYLFALSRQNDGQYKGCWMTDGLTREPPSPLQGMRFATRGTVETAGRS
jgi:hypothetical protein